MRRAFRIVLLLEVLLALIASPASAQSDLSIQLPDRVRISERSNLSTRVDGRYAGLLSRQVTGYLTRTMTGEYEGRFFRYTQVRRDLQAVARPIDESIPATTQITPRTLFSGAAAYPSYQDLLSLPANPTRVGETWDARAFLLVNPENTPSPMRLPVLVRYRYAGIEVWNSAPSHRIEAEFATRYPLPPPDDPDDPDALVVEYSGPITSVRGGHRMTILLPTEGGQLAFVRDEYAEEYAFSSGRSLRHEGHVLLFLTGLSVEAQQERAATLRDELEEAPGLDVVETTEGIRLTVRELRFVADQAVLLSGEETRLEILARALRNSGDARFLIVGHTADVGLPESQQRLSIERARTIAQELTRRGVSPDRLDIEGRGGTEPVATNANDAGRAQNRRVEIYVVEP